jgi:hypothetical protein
MNLTGMMSQASVGSLLWDMFSIVAVILSPFLIFATIIHWLERAIQLRLSERFGWNAVMWTGWLGAPIHELSHALACLIFKHKVTEIALFQPDRQSGRLGYVQHSWSKGNWYQEFGNVFIGIAPLVGGSVALVALLWIFYPDAARAAMESAQLASSSDDSTSAFGRVLESIRVMGGTIFQWSHLFTAKFWVFNYLVLCIGSHMAPSGSDYKGASRGTLMLGLLLGLVALVLAVMKTDTSLLLNSMIGVLAPVFAIFGLTIVLCFMSTVIVYLLTMFIPPFFR